MDLARELKKLWNIKVTVIPIIFNVLGTVPKGFEKETEGIRNQWNNQNHTGDSIVNIGQNNQKSPGDLSRLDVTQTLVNDHKLKLM